MIKKLVVSILLISLVLVVSGCIAGQNTKENAEAVAQDFAIELQNSNWEELYDLFTPELKAMRSKESFVTYISKKDSPLESNYLIFDKVVMQGDNEAYAYYTFSTGVLESKIPPMHLVFTREGWRVDGFAPYFLEGCLRDSECGSDKPICNYWYECVECEENSDCPDEKPVCYGYGCVECEKDSDCPSEKPACYVHSCVECRINSDCPQDKPVCLWDNVCAKEGEGIECVEDSDCSGTKPYCNNNGKYFSYVREDECIECRNDSDCRRVGKSYCSYGLCFF